ncbi:ferrous iron transport protein B [Corallincola luteus]|uniref:Ferrous iron transport protein B n=2 Tax=Corallincola TaxID=1775176 RepID=A0A368NQF8_9GAMM|nr:MULTISPECIES: ferrous iron transport protein B [Corallincola]RCU51924.1 ferrous iron transport protein B [Corallincola holothuriorum]TCI05088.1 ferrous iron transport protein B [Corallincola luteus]
MSKAFRCVIAGNANSGKSTLFNGLSGSNVSVGNWSGVTVDKKIGHFACEQQNFDLVDLPGLLDLNAINHDGLLDESISQQCIRQGEFDLLINLVDATQLERSLYLTLQLRELGVPMLVLLNKAEVVQARDHKIDVDQLAQQLDCPVMSISAKSPCDIKALVSRINTLCQQPLVLKPFTVPLGDNVEMAITKLGGVRADAIARLLMLNDEQAQQAHAQLTADSIRLSDHLATQRYALVDKIYQQAVTVADASLSLTERWDRYALNVWTGVPIFLGMMYLTFMFAINFGAAFIDFFDIVAGALFVDGFGQLLTSVGSPDWLTAILASGVGAGVQTVATFIPVVAFLYVALSILEISGYLARAGFVIEGLMQKIGLPGKAFVPLIVGFGCNVPSITATRTLDSRRERLVTAMMAPFMSCGARLPVYALFAAAFFPDNGQNLVFALYLIGIVAAILTGVLLRYTLLPGLASQGMMALPDYEMPTPGAIVRRTWHRTKQFVLGAGKMIVLVVTVLSFVNSIGTDGSFGNEDSETSLLSKTSQWVTPVFHPMGIADDNWPATVGIVTGIFAKEAVVGTLNSLYSHAGEEEEGGVDLLAALNEGLSTIPENLLGIAWEDPLGLDIGDVSNSEETAEAFGFETGTLTNLEAGFKTRAAAFAYLLFILLYTPCAAVLGAMSGEFGNRWTAFSAVYTFALAYAVATLFYQLSQFALQPLTSTLWISLIFVVSALVVWLLRRMKQPAKMGVGDIPVMIRE